MEKDGTSLTLESLEVNQRLSSETVDILDFVKKVIIHGMFQTYSTSREAEVEPLFILHY